MFGWWKTRADKPLLPEDQIARVYRKKRIILLAALPTGTGLFYLSRLALAAATDPMTKAGVVDNVQIGLMGTALFIAYAIGRFTNGLLGDHSNVARFIPTGLLISGLITMCFGCMSLPVVLIILWGLHGWFQSMSSAPSCTNMAHWFSKRERGRVYSIFSTGHNIGEALSFLATAAFISYFGQRWGFWGAWRWGFWGPGFITALSAFVFLFGYQDRPQTYGLPPVTEYEKESTGPPAPKLSPRELFKLQLEAIKYPWLWVVAVSCGLMYMTRYGINMWAISYLQRIKGYSLVQAGGIAALNPLVGFLGSISCGFISDLIFKGRREPILLVYGLIEIVGLVIFFRAPAENIWLHGVALGLYGFGIGGLLTFLGGLVGIDICPKRVAGAAVGFIGIFAYGSAALQNYISGRWIESAKTVVEGVAVYNYNSVIILWVGASILSFMLAMTLWKAKPKAD